MLALILNIFGIRQGFAQYDSVCFYADTLSDRYGHVRFERGEAGTPLMLARSITDR